MHSSKPSVMWKLLNILNVCLKSPVNSTGRSTTFSLRCPVLPFLCHTVLRRKRPTDGKLTGTWQLTNRSAAAATSSLQMSGLLNDLYSFISYFRSPYALICWSHYGFLFVCDKKYSRSPRKIHRQHNIRVANHWSSESNVLYSKGGVSTISCALYRSIFSDLSLLAALNYRVIC